MHKGECDFVVPVNNSNTAGSLCDARTCLAVGFSLFLSMATAHHVLTGVGQ